MQVAFCVLVMVGVFLVVQPTFLREEPQFVRLSDNFALKDVTVRDAMTNFGFGVAMAIASAFGCECKLS